MSPYLKSARDGLSNLASFQEAVLTLDPTLEFDARGLAVDTDQAIESIQRVVRGRTYWITVLAGYEGSSFVIRDVSAAAISDVLTSDNGGC